MTNKVKMLKTALGCDDGVVITQTYHEGREYEIGDSLLAAFIDMGVVELVVAGKTPAARETKVSGPDETKPLDLNTLKQPELLAIAKQHGLELKSNAAKKDIIAAIEAAQTLAGADTAA